MHYREAAPDWWLAPWVECGWTLTTEGERLHRVLPDGCIDVLWSEGEGVHVVGTMTRALVVSMDGPSRVAGVRFHPGAAPAVLGVPADALLDARVAPSELWGDTGKALEEAVAEASSPLDALVRWVARRARAAPRPDPLVRSAVVRLAAGGEVGDLGVSDRHLRRRMTAEVGYGPKRLARVLRLRRALDRAADHGLADAAFTAGYTDQSHFTNDCVDLAGLPPGRLLAA